MKREICMSHEENDQRVCQRIEYSVELKCIK